MTLSTNQVKFPEYNDEGWNMGFVVLAAFVFGWAATVKAYGKWGDKRSRPHLLGFGGGITTLVIVASILAKFEPSKPPSASKAASASLASKPLPQNEFVTVRALEIFDEYEANEIAADQKYKGKKVVVVGTAQSIDKDAFNNIVVHLQTRNQFMPVSATLLDKYESEAALMKRGEIVDFACIGAGRVIGSPILKDCRPLPADPPSKEHKKT